VIIEKGRLKMKNRFLRLFILALFLGGFLSACGSGGGTGLFYVSLGDSLSVGIQPDATGKEQTTDNGYADQLFAKLVVDHPDLQLVKFGCTSETTSSMITGGGKGGCTYKSGSQLRDAVDFLVNHKDQIFLVTIDIGVNDILDSPCVDTVNRQVDVPCLQQQLQQETASNLSLILSTIFQAVNRDTPVIGMNYYDPFLAVALPPIGDTAFATLSVQLLHVFNNDLLGKVYGLFGFPVADVSAKFQTEDPTPVASAPLPSPPFPPALPVNIKNICLFTFMCIPGPPVSPNIHATTPGYGVIAQAFGDVLATMP
jgi:lysophospholipase L1-like esterase